MIKVNLNVYLFSLTLYKDKKGLLKFEDMQNFYNDLINDKGCIGLIPEVNFEEVVLFFFQN